MIELSAETSIFISHSHENKLEALEIKDELELQGFDVHIDDELAGGRSFVEWIDKTLEQSTCLVLIWSNHSTGSYWQNREWRSYLSGKVKRDPDNNTIIIIRMNEAEVPLILNDLKWFDYDDSAESAKKIASALRGVPVENMRELLAKFQEAALEFNDPLPFICTNCGHFPLNTKMYGDDFGDNVTIVAKCEKCHHSYSYSPEHHSKPREPEDDYDAGDDLFDIHFR